MVPAIVTKKENIEIHQKMVCILQKLILIIGKLVFLNGVFAKIFMNMNKTEI